MRKLKHPSWADWQKYLETELSTTMKLTGLTGYRLGSGASTNKTIPVKSIDKHTASLPYVQLILSEVQEGWDDNNSAQEDYQRKNYTNLGAGKQLKKSEELRERVTWTIEAFTQKHEEAITIAQTIKRYFNCRGDLRILWQDEDYEVFTKLHNYSIEAAEADREGNIEFFRVSWLLTLYIKTDLLTQDEIVKGITETVVETAVLTEEDGNADAFTKTLS